MKKICKIIFSALGILILVCGLLLGGLYLGKLFSKNDTALAEPDAAIVQLKEQVKELNENVNTLLIVVEEKDYKIGVMTFALDEAEEELNEKNTALITLSNEVTRKNGEIDKLKADNANLEKELNGLKTDIEANAQKIAEVEAKVDDNSAKITILQTELKSITQTISQTEFEVSELDIKIEDLRADIQDIQMHISEINTEIENMNTKIDSLNSSIQMLLLGSIKKIHIAQTNKYETSYVVFGNGLCLQWAFNNCSSKGVINQKLAKVYTTTTYLVMITPATMPTSTTVWGARVNTVYTDHFVGYLTNRTSGSNDYSNGGGYYWFTIGQISDADVAA